MATDMDVPVIRDPLGGANQSGMRDHNERLVLSLVLRHGALPSAEIARRANLSAQTVSIIIRALEKDGLLLRGEPQRGKVGKPSIPMMLNPDGILSFGLNIGRKSADLALVDITGAVRVQYKKTYPYPTPGVVMAFLKDGYQELSKGLTPKQRRRIAGIGVAAPFELWNWLDTVNAPKEGMQAWRDFDIAENVARATGLPVTIQNDATAACTAEHTFGRGKEFSDYAYFFIGSFIGGGVVLNDTVYTGRHGNAGAFGSIPVATEDGPTQLINHASLYLLERALDKAGKDASELWKPESDWSDLGKPLDDWIAHTSHHLAVGIVAVASVIDFEAILIDANCPASVKRRIIDQTRDAIDRLDTQGIGLPVVAEASVGRNARVIGAAALRIIERHLLSRPRFN